MYKLQRLNVVKVVSDDNEKDKLLSQGFKLIDDKKSEDNEGKNADYSAMTVAELKEVAKNKGIENYSNMKKEELLVALGENNASDN